MQGRDERGLPIQPQEDDNGRYEVHADQVTIRTMPDWTLGRCLGKRGHQCFLRELRGGVLLAVRISPVRVGSNSDLHDFLLLFWVWIGAQTGWMRIRVPGNRVVR